MELLLAVVLIALVAAFVSVPLRRRQSQCPGERRAAELEDLEARKRAKYREIRDAEADREAGKLNGQDFELLDAELRRDAIEILKRIDALRGTGESRRTAG